MRTSSVVLLVLCTAGASALLAVHWASSSGPRATEVGESVPVSSAGSARDPGPTASAPREPARRVAVESGFGEAVGTLQEAALELESARVFEQDDRTVADKYAGASLPQLMAALSLLSERRDAERARIGQQLIDAGRLELVTGGGEGGPATRSANPDGSPVTSVDRYELVDGVAVTKSAVITAEEFPDYRALELEVWWLQCRVHALKKSPEPSAR